MSSTMPLFLLTAILCLVLPGPSKDKDTDRDGLPDFHEIHKYLTDPTRADTDGDGKRDSDRDERREYTYTVECTMHIMPPFDIDAMNDDFQDARLLERGKDFVTVEVIVYPFNTCSSAIGASKNWSKPPASLKEYTKPGVTTNWNKKMRKDLLAALKKDGIDVPTLTDREAVEKVSAWLMENSEFEDCFTTFAVIFPGGKAKVAPGMSNTVDNQLKKNGRTLKAQWDREIFGRGMFYNRVHGSCTSSAIYLSTGLKAIGLPARTIVCFPVLDASDPDERTLGEALTHHRVREIVLESAKERGNSWASHTFNEVYVDGRWRRLNYQKLGQNILDRNCLGLMVHVHTFADHSRAGLVTWGKRNASSNKNDIFGHSNPYSFVSLSDRFGAHSDIPNPEEEEAHRTLTITRLYWYHDENKPAVVQMRLDDAHTAGHLVMHVAEGFADEGPGQYKEFYEKVGKEFVLKAKGRPDIPARAVRGYWTNVAKGIKDFYLRIEPDDFKQMAKGVNYSLVALSTDNEHKWCVAPGVEIVREN